MTNLTRRIEALERQAPGAQRGPSLIVIHGEGRPIEAAGVLRVGEGVGVLPMSERELAAFNEKGATFGEADLDRR